VKIATTLPFPSHLYTLSTHTFPSSGFPTTLSPGEERRREWGSGGWDSLAGRKTLKADKSFRLPCHTENKCKLRCCRLPKTFDRKGKTTTTPEEKATHNNNNRDGHKGKTKRLYQLKLSWFYLNELHNRYYKEFLIIFTFN